MSTLRRLPTDLLKFRAVLRTAGVQHQRLDQAADAILAHYVVPRRLQAIIVRHWLMVQILEFRHPEPVDPAEDC